MLMNALFDILYLHSERTKVVRTILCEPKATDLETIAANTIIQNAQPKTNYKYDNNIISLKYYIVCCLLFVVCITLVGGKAGLLLAAASCRSKISFARAFDGFIRLFQSSRCSHPEIRAQIFS
jgi:hypothetical protein